MGFLSRILGKKKKDYPEESSSSYAIPHNHIYDEEVDSCAIATLIFEKKYQEAIDMGEKMLKKYPCDAMLHINLMDAYFKSRMSSPSYMDKSTYHARCAILCGHNTGYAHHRLAINLEKEKKYHLSVQLYNLILDTDGFHFATHGVGNSIDFAVRREKAKQHMDKALDKEDDVLFTTEEIKNILGMIEIADEKEKKEKAQYDKLMSDMKKSMDEQEWDKFYEEMNALRNKKK